VKHAAVDRLQLFRYGIDLGNPRRKAAEMSKESFQHNLLPAPHIAEIHEVIDPLTNR
jgi:hypothetical protein